MASGRSGNTAIGRRKRRISMSSRSTDRLSGKRRRGRRGRRDGIMIKIIRRTMDLFFESGSPRDSLPPPIRHYCNCVCVCWIVFLLLVFELWSSLVVAEEQSQNDSHRNRHRQHRRFRRRQHHRNCNCKWMEFRENLQFCFFVFSFFSFLLSLFAYN